MKRLKLLLCIFSTVYNFIGQEKYLNTEFPKDWLGNYEGLMYMAHAEMGLIDSVKVQFHLNPTKEDSVFTYIMIYDSPKFGKIVKDYFLKVVSDPSTNSLLLDEKDGIIIPEILIGNTIYSNFEVANVQISTILRNHGDFLDFELISTEPSYSLDTESFPDENGDTYIVTSSYPKATQFVRLYRITGDKKWKNL